MKSIKELKENRKAFLGLTTLYPEEFDLILPIFSELWYKFYKIFTLEGKRRKIKNWRPQKDTKTLATTEDKLFFLLSYYKENPLQEFQGMTFELSQGKVSMWVKLLTPMLKEALNKLDLLPCRQGGALEGFLEDIPGSETINIDAVEQVAPRSIDDEAQRAQYSGKRRTHTYKNQVNCLDNQQVVYLSPTYLGSVHDKRIADEEECLFPSGTRVRQDAAYLSYEPEGVHIEMPFKKPRNGELTGMQKWYNQYVAQRRIVVEHAIRGIKRFKIVQYICRLKGYWIRDQIMNICTAIHNLRVKSPLRKYESQIKFQL